MVQEQIGSKVVESGSGFLMSVGGSCRDFTAK
jgi:hypothetical protein